MQSSTELLNFCKDEVVDLLPVLFDEHRSCLYKTYEVFVDFAF